MTVIAGDVLKLLRVVLVIDFERVEPLSLHPV